jgi:DNA-binding NtrC family response regulator
MAARVLMCWIGNTDLRALAGDPKAGEGPIAQALAKFEFDEVELLSDYDEDRARDFAAWLRKRGDATVRVRPVKLTSPMEYGEIYEAARAAVRAVMERHQDKAELTFHLSPGTPPMAAMWILLGKTQFSARLIDSSRDHGVRVADVPFEIAAEFVPSLMKPVDDALERGSAAVPKDEPSLSALLGRSPEMGRLRARAQQLSAFRAPVLIEGESGTGKELLARAIHYSGPRRSKPFLAINCGAIAPELVEAELFGYLKGSFTGAIREHKGLFEAAHGGTVFLDEVGELPPRVQVKLLRVVQEREIVRIGDHKSMPVDARIVAATHRSMVREVSEGRFREDLFYRLAVLVLRVPPLRDRRGDVGFLLDHFLAETNKELRELGQREKKLSVAARNILLQHRWPGNVRELQGTLMRAAVWSTGVEIRADDVRDALLEAPAHKSAAVLDQPLGEGFSINAVIEKVAKHYLERALREAEGSKTQAAKLVGLNSYQTLTNWLQRYGVDH